MRDQSIQLVPSHYYDHKPPTIDSNELDKVWASLFSTICRLTRVRHLRAGKYAWVCRCPGARALPMQDSSSDDEQPLTSTVAASKGPTSATSTNRANKQSSRCLRPSSSHIKKPHIDELVMAGGIVQQRVPFRLKGSRSTNEEEEEESTIEE